MLSMKFLCLFPRLKFNSNGRTHNVEKCWNEETNSVLLRLIVTMHSSKENHLELVESIVVEPDEENEEDWEKTTYCSNCIEKFAETSKIVILLVCQHEDGPEEDKSWEVVWCRSAGRLGRDKHSLIFVYPLERKHTCVCLNFVLRYLIVEHSVNSWCGRTDTIVNPFFKELNQILFSFLRIQQCIKNNWPDQKLNFSYWAAIWSTSITYIDAKCATLRYVHWMREARR